MDRPIFRNQIFLQKETGEQYRVLWISPDTQYTRHHRYVWVELGCSGVRSTWKRERNATETKQNHGNQVFNVAESVGHTNGEFDLVVCGLCTSVRKAVSNR